MEEEEKAAATTGSAITTAITSLLIPPVNRSETFRWFGHTQVPVFRSTGNFINGYNRDGNNYFLSL